MTGLHWTLEQEQHISCCIGEMTKRDQVSAMCAPEGRPISTSVEKLWATGDSSISQTCTSSYSTVCIMCMELLLFHGMSSRVP